VVCIGANVAACADRSNVVGECYGGSPRQPQTSFFNEVTGNLMRNSNGIDINDGKGPWKSGALAACPYQVAIYCSHSWTSTITDTVKTLINVCSAGF
jgi:hypothetical protein